MRVCIEEPCEVCGLYEMADHQRRAGYFDQDGEWQVGEWCIGPGGSRRVLEPGEYVLVEKVDGEWPELLEHVWGIMDALASLSAEGSTERNEK